MKDGEGREAIVVFHDSLAALPTDLINSSIETHHYQIFCFCDSLTGLLLSVKQHSLLSEGQSLVILSTVSRWK